MKRILIFMLLTLLLSLAMSGCNAPVKTPVSSLALQSTTTPTVAFSITVGKTTFSSPNMSDEPTTEASVVTEPSPTDPVTSPESFPSIPANELYRCDPYLFYANLSDADVYPDACRLVDAIAAHEDSLTVSDPRVAGILVDNIFYNYPPAALCTFKKTADGIDIGYIYPEATHREKIAAFYAKVEEILNTVLDVRWSTERKAMELYRWTADEVNYFTVDYTPADTNAYSAIMRGKSICYGFSDCYNYLLRQVGIPAEMLRGYRPSDHADHGWSMIQLGGNWVHCDPTWESSSSDGQGLHYFGMSDSKRFSSIAKDVVCGFGDAETTYSCHSCNSTRYDGVSAMFRYTPWTWERVEEMLE